MSSRKETTDKIVTGEISKHKQAKELLWKCEERFHKIFNHSNDAIFVIDPVQDEILDVNPRACAMLGFSREELLSMTISNIHPNEMPQLQAFAARVFEKGEGWTNELTCMTKSGHFLPSEISASAIDIAGRRCMVAMVRDTTERKKAEQALAESEERYRELYENAPLAYCTVGADGLIRLSNERLAKMLGYARDELIGRPVLKLYADTASGKQKAKEVFKNFLTGKEPKGEELELQTADGKSVWVSLTVRAMRDAHGEVVESRSMLVDITRRKLMEHALRESEQRFAGIFNSAMDAIVIVDAGGCVRMMNAAAEKVFRCTASETVGSPLASFLSRDFMDLLCAYLREVEEKGITHRYLWSPEGLTAIRSDGEEFSAEATVSHFVIGGQELCTIILRDIQDRKRTEAELRKLERESSYLREELETLRGFGEMVASSTAMEEVFQKIQEVAATDATVLIIGETGTGKELVARAIHGASDRKDGVLVKVDCAALPAGLIESELFGHEKGAFTGAHARKIGRFELADGGTIFLDEIGDLPLELQAKLLRVLQEGEFERLGGSGTITVDVRVIAATNRDLEKTIEEGSFRADLYYRLNVFPIHIPPLRERKDDIPHLVRHFVMKQGMRLSKRIETVPPKTMDALMSYSWPGNVRELANIIERAVIISPGKTLELGDWLAKTAETSGAASIATLEELEKKHILEVLALTGWKVSGEKGAAKILGMKPTTLESRMKKLGIKRMG
jgi:PAS domain S-box-containing protein